MGADAIMALRFSAILRELITVGLAGEELIAAVERIEGRSSSVRSSAAERQARYRARMSSRDAVDVTNVTGDAVTSRDVTHNAPSSFFYKKESTNEEKKEEREIENTRARGDFDEFWDVFPNKVGKQAAKTSFEKVCKSNSVTFDVMMSALRRYVTKTDDRPWCNPATWLNQGRWDDQPAEVKSGKSAVAAADRLIDRLGGMEAANAYVPGSSGPAPLVLDFGQVPAGPKLISSR